MKYYPAFINIEHSPVLVVGGGKIATRKVRLLLKCNARVEIVSPELTPELTQLAEQGKLTWHRSYYEKKFISGKILVLATTDDADINHQVYTHARELNILVNVADNGDLSSFITPTLVDRDPLQIAITSGGASPVLIRLIRQKLEKLLPHGLGKLVAFAGKQRKKVKDSLADVDKRYRFWQDFFDGILVESVSGNSKEKVEQRFLEQLSGAQSDDNKKGEVALVGAGCGNPDLLTLAAVRQMQSADVVVYDRLVSDEIMALVRPDAKRVYVGKAREHHSVPQNEINQLLIDLANQGKKVCRLKGGDPFIFGRGGEELQELAEKNIPFIVIPAITAALGCSAYAGIPLTHRDYAQSCLFVTAHTKDGELKANWQAIAKEGQTVVFYMGLKGLPIIQQKLLEHGISEDMPLALVENGTRKDQRVMVTDLANLVDTAEKDKPISPCLLIMGRVVNLRQELNWFQ